MAKDKDKEISGGGGKRKFISSLLFSASEAKSLGSLK